MQANIKRLDHLGVIAGVINDLGIIELADELLGKDDQVMISHGEALAGMIINGLGFTNRPLTLTPQFFENKAMSLLFRKGAKAEHFNRHKLGRTLDSISDFGSEQFFSALSLQACEREGVDLSFGHTDTTSYSVSGSYDTEFDTYPITLTYGYSKDNKPGCKQVIHELMVSQDGGIPFATKALDGNASDSVVFRERAEKIMDEFSKSTNKCLVADSKLFTQKTANYLNHIFFITRVPGTIHAEQEHITQAIASNDWEELEGGNYKIQEAASNLFEITGLRLVTVYSEHARARSEKTLQKKVDKESEQVGKDLFHLQAQRYSCKEDGLKALNSVVKKWKFHNVSDVEIIEHKKYEKAGAPKKGAPQISSFQIQAQASLNQESVDLELDKKSCFVLGTNIPSEKLSAAAVLKNYKAQDKVEKGFAFLKSHEFFASSFYLKSPKRIDALITIMTLALLVYSIAQRRLRNQLIETKQTLPNQINKSTTTPTMRWIFQLLEGVNYVNVTINDEMHVMIEGLTELRTKILRLLGPSVMTIYKIV